MSPLCDPNSPNIQPETGLRRSNRLECRDFFYGYRAHHKDNTAWLPFLDTYRTMCLAPELPFRRVLEEIRAWA